MPQRYNEQTDTYVYYDVDQRQVYTHRTPDEAIAEGRRRAEATVREYVRQDAEIDNEEIAAWMDINYRIVNEWPASGDQGWMSETAVKAAELLEYFRMYKDPEYLQGIEARFEAERGQDEEVD